MAPSQPDDRIAAVERIVRLFWPERMIGLVVGLIAIALIALIAIQSLVSGEFDNGVIGALIGSGGLISVACAQTFFIFNRAMSMLEKNG